MNRFAAKKNLECGRKWLAKRGFSSRPSRISGDRFQEWIAPGKGLVVSEPEEQAMLDGVFPENRWTATFDGEDWTGRADSPEDAIVNMMLDSILPFLFPTSKGNDGNG